LKSSKPEDCIWGNKNLGKKENTARELDLVADAGPMGLLSGVTIYIYAGNVLGK
jgi:hypothetical protein